MCNYRNTHMQREMFDSEEYVKKISLRVKDVDTLRNVGKQNK